MFIKVVDTETLADGSKKVLFVTPTVEEVIDDLSIDMKDSNISLAIDYVRMNHNVTLALNGVSLPKGAKGKLSSFSPKIDIEHHRGKGWNLLKDFSASFEIPVESEETTHTKSLKLSGKYTIKNFNMTAFRFKTFHAGEKYLGIKNKFINDMTPVVGVDYDLGMEWDSEKEFELEGKIEKKFSLAKIAKDSMFECGFEFKSSNYSPPLKTHFPH